MSKSYRPYDPDQQLLLPAVLQQWLPEDHLAYFISDVVDQLDLFYQVLTLRRQAVEGLHGLCVDPFVAPEQTRHGRVLPPAPRDRIPRHMSARERMRRKLRTKRGRKRCALRM